MSAASIRNPPLPDGEYDIDVTALLLDDKFEENFAIRYGFVPESIDDDLPFQLVKDTITTTTTTNNTSTEELYILKAESTTSSTNPILFEGSLNKSNSTSISDAALSNDYVLVYDNVGKNFKLEKLNSMIRMSKSRNEATLLKKLAKLDTINKDKVNEQKELIRQFALKTQQSIRRPKAKVRNDKFSKSDKIVIPQTIPMPSTTNTNKPPPPTTTKKSNVNPKSLKNGNKISTSKIRQSIKKKSQKPISSPLVQTFKKSDSVTNSTSNSDIDEMDLDKLIDAELDSDTDSKIVQPKPTLPLRQPTQFASKRLPTTANPTPLKNLEQESDSDLGSLAFELEEALESGGGTTTTAKIELEDANSQKPNDDGWAEPNMDWEMDEDDFDFNDDGDSNFNIVIDESPLSQNDSNNTNNTKKGVVDLKDSMRESTPSGPISMKELASLRAGSGGGGGGSYRESSPVILTPGISSSAKFKNQPRIANISAVATPKLSDDTFLRSDSQSKVYQDDEDISEEE